VKSSNTAAVVDKYRERIVNGPVLKTLIWLGTPLMIVQLVNVSYNIADAYWLSRYSNVAMAVPRQVWPSFMFFNALAMALSTANMALLSQYIGAKVYDKASEIASKFFTVASLTGIVLGLAYFTIRELIFKYIVATPPEIFNDVVTYAGIISFDLLLSYFTLTYSTVFQSIGDTKTPAIVNGIAASLNIVLDPIMILGLWGFPRLGVAGAAIATVLSRFVGVIVLLTFIKRKFPELKVGFTKHLGADWVISNLRIGLPVFIFHISNSMAFMFQSRLVNSFGVAVAAAFSIGFIIMDLADAMLWGFTASVAIMVGQNLGAGNLSRSKSVAWKALYSIALLTFIGTLLVYPARHFLVSSFTNDEIIYSEAITFIETFLFSLPFFAMFFVSMSVGRGSGHTLFPTLVGMGRLWGVRIGVGYLLAYGIGLGSYGVWLAMSLSNYISGLAAILWIRYGRWNKPVIKKH